MENPREHQKPVKIDTLKLLETDQVFLLACERLGHTHTGDVLRDGARDARTLRAQVAVGFHSILLEEPGGHRQGRDHNAHGEAQAAVVLQQEDHHAEQSQGAGEQLVRAPGQHPVERVDVRVGAADDSALVGLVEVIERKPLDVLEDCQTQIVHRALADGDGAFDLGCGQKPTEQQVGQVDHADQQNAPECVLCADQIREVTVDAELNELRAEQLGQRRQQRQEQVESEQTPVRAHITKQPQERRPAHGLLLESLLQ